MEDDLARDLVAMWQSELTAMAVDRELRESWAALVALWAQSCAMGLAFAHEHAARSSGAVQPPWPTAVAAASQPGLGEVERLERRIAELERRLAEAMAPRPGADRRGEPARGV